MLKNLGLSLLLAAATMSSETYATTISTIHQAGATMVYELKPGEPTDFINYMFWAVEANCHLVTEDNGEVPLYAVALAKSGRLNGMPWTKGQSLTVTVHNNEDLKIYAESGAKVSITNQGQQKVTATCSN